MKEEDFMETALNLNMEMVYVEGGEFGMGATEEQGADVGDKERSMRNIKLDEFHIGKYEVTQAQWRAVMGTSLRDHIDRLRERQKWSQFEWKPYGEGDEYPMYYVSWEDAQEFCRRLSKATGRKYMLPTEAQWEYAARGGNRSKHYKYAGSNDIDDVAWYRRNSGNWGSGHPDYGAHPVGMKKANELGIYDMSGNVWEWCSDWYMDRYDKDDDYNLRGPVTGFDRVHRGGGWNSHVEGCHVSYRLSYPPHLCGSDLGFRVTCILK